MNLFKGSFLFLMYGKEQLGDSAKFFLGLTDEQITDFFHFE